MEQEKSLPEQLKEHLTKYIDEYNLEAVTNPDIAKAKFIVKVVKLYNEFLMLNMKVKWVVADDSGINLNCTTDQMKKILDYMLEVSEQEAELFNWFERRIIEIRMKKNFVKGGKNGKVD